MHVVRIKSNFSSIFMRTAMRAAVMAAAVVTLVAIVASRGILGSEADQPDHIVEPEELAHLTVPPQPNLYDSWTDWETWEASPEIANLMPYNRSGYDYDGLVVYTVHFAKLSYRELAHLPAERRQEFWKYYEQLFRRAGRDAAMCNDQGMVFIGDWDGFSLANYASGGALKECLKMFVSFVRLNGYINYGIFVNVNFAAETFLNTARPFLGNIMEKFEVYGTRREKWKPRVLRSIPAGQLPPRYGGVEDWKPLPFN